VDSGQRIVVIGGSLTDGRLFVLDTTTMTWSIPTAASAFNAATGPLIGHTSALVGRKIFIFGGGTLASDGQLIGTSRMFSLDIDSFEYRIVSPDAGQLWPQPRMFHGVLVRASLSRFYIVGGVLDVANTANYTSVWQFDVESGRFSNPRVTGSMPRSRFGVSFSPLGNSGLILFGGVDSIANVSRWHLSGFSRDFLHVMDVSPVSAKNFTFETVSFRSIQLDKLDGGFPFHRIAHSAVYDITSAGLFVHGGLFAARRSDKYSIRFSGIGGDFVPANQAYFIRMGCARGFSKYVNANATLADSAIMVPCNACPASTFQVFSAGERPVLERVVCIVCPVGSFSNVSASATCTLCPIGFYNDVTNATECKACPVDSTTEDIGTSTVSKCIPVQKQALIAGDSRAIAIGASVGAIVFVAVIVAIFVIYRRSRNVNDRLLCTSFLRILCHHQTPLTTLCSPTKNECLARSR
jgi:hypothetical protein